MSIVIANQVEASEKSANQLEAELRREHHGAMLCFDVQDLMRSVTSIYANMNADVERWQARSTGAPAPSEAELAGFESICAQLYRRLEAVCGRTVGLARAMETIGFRDVSGQKELLEVWRELRGIASLSIDKVKRASQQIRDGKVRSLAEVRDELWDSPVR